MSTLNRGIPYLPAVPESHGVDCHRWGVVWTGCAPKGEAYLRIDDVEVRLNDELRGPNDDLSWLNDDLS